MQLLSYCLLYGCETWTLLADWKQRIKALETQVLEETSPHFLLGAQDQWLGTEQDQLAYASTGTSSGNCRETETGIARACHTSRQPLQNHSSRHFGEWAMPWPAEEMLAVQCERVDIPAHARTAHKGRLQKTLEKDLCWTVRHVPPKAKSVKALSWAELFTLTRLLKLMESTGK